MKTDNKAMRNIRVWIKPLHLYLPILMINLGRYKVCCGDKEDSDWYDFSEVVFEYSTGLYDKNGNEIYDGDVLLIHDTIKKQIYYQHDLASFRMFNLPIDNWTSNDQPITQKYLNELCGLVIGNIHENPELLEQK